MVVVRATMWWVRNGKLRAREGGGDSGVVAMLVALVAVVGGDARARARIAGALTATSCASPAGNLAQGASELDSERLGSCGAARTHLDGG